jgi:hypothetical protein
VEIRFVPTEQTDAPISERSKKPSRPFASPPDRASPKRARTNRGGAAYSRNSDAFGARVELLQMLEIQIPRATPHLIDTHTSAGARRQYIVGRFRAKNRLSGFRKPAPRIAAQSPSAGAAFGDADNKPAPLAKIRPTSERQQIGFGIERASERQHV